MYAQLQTEINTNNVYTVTDRDKHKQCLHSYRQRYTQTMYTQLQTEINTNNVCTVTDRDKHKQCVYSYTHR